MKKYLPLLLILFAVLSCNTGKKALKRGNYYDATMQSVQHLRLKPESASALETIKKSYPMLLDYNQQRINQLLQSNAPDKYLGVVEMYSQLNRIADEIMRSPAALEAVKPVQYFNDQIKTAKDLAAKEQFNEGLRLLETGLLDDARMAYSHFEKAKQCNPVYPDIEQMLIKSDDLATLKIVVEQVPVHSQSYQVSAKVFYDRMFHYLKKSVEKKFIRFYQPTDAEQLKIVPHHIIRMQFEDFSVGNLREREVVQDFSADSVVVGSYTDNQGITYDVFGTVKAKVSTYEREVLSKGILDVRVIDFSSKQVLTDRKFPGEFIWRNDWATFNGDRRAIPAEKIRLIDQKQVPPPLPQELFLLFSDPIFANSSSYLASFYRRR